MPLDEDFASAFASLAASQSLRQLLAENLYWASCEALVQSAALYSFNSTSTQFIADRERQLDGLKPDLLAFDRQDHDQWWTARSLGDREALGNLTKGLVQFKVAWTEGNANGSAKLGPKTRAIRTDIDRLRAWGEVHPGRDLFWAVLLGGFHEPGAGVRALSEAEETIGGSLKQGDGSELRRITVLNDASLPWRPPHARVASAALLWSAVK